MTSTTLNSQFIVGAVLTGLVLIFVFVAGILNIKGTKGPLERRFILLVTPILWAMVLAFIASMYFLRPPVRYVALMVFFVLIPLFMYRCTLRRLLIRELESRDRPPVEPAA